jgi:nucleoside-diphosphate-sugar epimerase
MILITGTRGYIGGHLQSFLQEKGFKIATFHSSEMAFNPSYCELQDEIEVIIFCGGFMPHSPSDVENYNQALKAKNIIKFISKYKFKNLKKIIFFSTTDIYLPGPNLTESSSFEGGNLYTQTKIEQEQIVRDEYLAIGVSTVILRIGNVYGPGDYVFNKFIPRLLKCAILEEEFQLHINQNNIAQPIFIEDLLSGVAKILNVDGSLLINFVSPDIVTFREIISVINELKKVKIEETDSKEIPERSFKQSEFLKNLNIKWTPLSIGLGKDYRFEERRINCS